MRNKKGRWVGEEQKEGKNKHPQNCKCLKGKKIKARNLL